MKKKFSGQAAFFLLAGLLLASCQPPISQAIQSDDDDEIAPASLEEAAKATLMNLPELKMKLPKSLSLDESATVSRALGDTTELTVEMLPALKSQAWYNLQSSDYSMMGYINKAFDYLKAYAKDNTIPAGEVFTVPFGDDQLVEMLDLPDELRGIFTTSLLFNIQGDSAEEFKIYGDITLSGGNTSFGMMDVNVKTRFDVVYSGSDSAIEMYFWFDLNQSCDGQSYTMTMPMYATFDSKTGACSLVSSSNDNGVIYSMIEATKVASDGSISNVNASLNNGVLQYLHVAYGDDTAGGIASMNSWTNTYINPDGSSTEHQEDYYWGEYYDQNGELLRRDNGNSRLWVPVGDEVSYTNLSTLGYTVAPDTYSTRSYSKSEDDGAWYQYRERSTGSGWEAYAREYSSTESDGSWAWVTQKLVEGVWINDYKWSYGTGFGSYYDWDGSTWTAMSGCPQNGSWSFMYKTDTTPGVWTAGDTVYYWKSGTSYTLNDIYYWQTDFYKGYVVPVPENRFGKQYWVNYEYPLGRLLPLAEPYATQYKLIQEEGETYTSSWTDWNGNSQEWSWTNYQYYLNKSTRLLEGVAVTTEDPIRYEDAFDIQLNDKLSQYDMYYWGNGTMSKVKAYFVRTTGALPAYFSAPSSTAIEKVNQKLGELMDSAYALGLDAYAAKLEAAETATDGVF